MEALEQHKQLVNGSIAKLSSEWEQQLQEKIEECDWLQKQVDTLQNEVGVKNDTIKRVQDENDHLKERLTGLQLRCGSDEDPRLKALIEKHNNLYKEHEVLKATAAANQHALIKQLRKERDKLRSWHRFSSPAPLSARLPAVATSNTIHKDFSLADGPKARSSFIGDGKHVGGHSHTQENDSYQQNRVSSPQIEYSPAGPMNCISFDNLQSRSDHLRKDDGAPKRSRLIEQPPEDTGLGSSFVDAHLPQEPRVASPELPSPPRTRQCSLVTDTDSSDNISKALTHDSLPHIRHSDSTAAPSEGPTMAEIEEALADDVPSSDTPEFLEARCIKKKTVQESPAQGQTSAGNASEPVTIKSDPDTSFVASKPQLIRLASSMHESLDPSPLRSEARSPRKHRPPRFTPSPSTDQALCQSPAILEIVTSQRGTTEPTSVRAPKSLSDQSTICRKLVHAKAEQAAPLRQIDGNARNGPRKVEFTSDSKSRKRKYADSRGAEAIPTISEDGEELITRARKVAKDHTSSPYLANPSVQQRLETLLTRPPTPKECLLRMPRKTVEEMDKCLSLGSISEPPKDKEPPRHLFQSDEKNCNWSGDARELVDTHKERAPRSSCATPRQQGGKTDQIISNTTTLKPTPEPCRPPGSTPTSRPATARKTRPRSPCAPAEIASHTRYRSLPLSSLNLTHFKLNPSANHNLNYAYTDVVRNQSDRKCFPGCTRPECCGRKFAALAQTLPHPTSSAAPLSPPATESALLKDYLGPDHYESLTPAERLRFLLDARTAQLANKYGKAHRALHPRPPSPPGFWNVDFPGTQERVEERTEAEKRERDEVARRWRESMKNPDPRDNPGVKAGRGSGSKGGETGLWMFADE